SVVRAGTVHIIEIQYPGNIPFVQIHDWMRTVKQQVPHEIIRVGVELIEHPITVIVTEHVSRSSAFNHEGVPQIITDIIFNEVVGAAPPQINAVGSTRSVVVERSVMKIAATHFVP